MAAEQVVFGAIDIAVLSLYFVAVVATGIYAMCASKRDTTSGYFLAGRFITFIPIGASLFASNIGSEHFIGLAGSGAAAGIGVGAFEINALIMLQILGWLFLPVYLSSGVYTLPGYIQKRFGGRRILVYLSFLSLAIYILTKMSVNLYSGSLFIKTALHWDLAPSISLLIGLTAFCTITGGLAAVIYTDTIQAFLMCTGGLTMMVFAFIEVGGISELYTKYMEVRPSNMSENGTCGVPRADSLRMLRDAVDSDIPWPAFILGQSAASIWYWCADQVIVQRALAAKSLSHAQGGTLFAGYLKILPLFMMVMPGMISRVLYPDEIACAVPEICEEVCGNSAGCSNLAYPKLIMNLMPVGLRGLMVAVMLAALITDLTSIFNSASSLFTMDIYPLFRKKPSNREQMIVGRLFVVVMTLCSIFWIPVVQNTQGGQLFIYIQAITAYLAPPIAAVFLTAILWPRVNEQGAFWSLMAGLVTGGIRMILDFSFPDPVCDKEDTRPFIVAKVHYMYFALLLFCQTVAVMAVVSLLTRPSEEWRTIRTVFWRRFDDTVRPDEMPLASDEALLGDDGPSKTEESAKVVASNAETLSEGISRVGSSVEMVAIVKPNNERTGKDAAELQRGVIVIEPLPSDEEAANSVTCCQRIGAPSTIDPETGERKRAGQLFLAWLKVLLGWFCGFSVVDGQPNDQSPFSEGGMSKLEKKSGRQRSTELTLKQKQEAARLRVQQLVEAITQTPNTRKALAINLVVIIAIALFLLVFFSLPPDSNGLI